MPSLELKTAPAQVSALLLVVFLVPGLLAAPVSAAESTAPAGGTRGEDVDRIVLRVNDEIFTLFEYEQRKARRNASLLGDPSISPAERQERLASAGKEVMQQALHDMLLASQARRAGVTISDREVDQSIEDVKKEQGIETQEELESALAQAGLTLDQLRVNFRKEMLTGRLVQKEVTSKIEVNEDEMRAYYRNHPGEFKTPEERKLREVIVLESSGLPESELEKTALVLEAELKAPGVKQEDVVARYQDQGYTTGLIELGWLKQDELEKSISEAAWSVEVGQFSSPVKARGGYHIVLLDEKRGGEVQPYADVEKQIQGRERQKRFGKEYRTYLAQLEKGSFIQENLPPETIGYRSLLDSVLEDDELQGFRAPLEEEKPATETDKPATDKPATDKPATDKPATDKPAGNLPAAP